MGGIFCKFLSFQYSHIYSCKFEDSEVIVFASLLSAQ